MKKLFAILLAVTLIASMATVVSAADTTTLTTTVPAANYTLNIPANQEITYGETSTDIGTITVSNATGFAAGKNLKVTVTYDAFTSEGVSTTIPFVLTASGVAPSQGNKTSTYDYASGSAFVFKGNAAGGVNTPTFEGAYNLTSLLITVDSADWGKALAGDYTATITFNTEVVAE